MAKRTAETIATETLLSKRQAEILLLKQRGMAHPEIAAELGIEKGTVDAQSSRINEKADRAQRTVEEVTGPALHARETLPDGTAIGKLGGVWQLLDETDRPVGQSFHEIVLAKDGYYGRLGATWYAVDRYGEVQEEGVEAPDDVLTDGGEALLKQVKRQYAEGDIDYDELESQLDHIFSTQH